MLIKSFHDVESLGVLINPFPNVENLGGKGYQLSLLNNICLVPEFFVICFENDNAIDILSVQEEIIKVFDLHNFECVSVRSSATVEDSKNASFAGMFNTKLNITKDKLIRSIHEVFKSSKNERVVEYCKLIGVDINDIKVRIVVQRMVNSNVAGVSITKDPGNPDIMLIEACWGIGETLVSGMITPDTYKVKRSNLVIESLTIGYQKKILTPNNGIQDVPFHRRNAKKLKDTELIELSKICLFIEKELNYQIADIEWAFENGKLYILQARPFVGKI